MNDFDYTKQIDVPYVFENGDSLTIKEIKRRDEGIFVAYFTIQSNGIPKQNLVPIWEFNDNFGHLFTDN